MQISFGRAVPTDVDTLVKAQIAAFHHDSVLYPDVEIGGPPGYDSVEDTLDKLQDSLYYTILCDGQIVGGMVVYDMGEGRVHLDLIYIVPAYQGTGIGSQAMDFLEQTYAVATRWTLDTPSWAVRNQHFYEKFGYVKMGEHPADDIILFAYEKRV